jgi:hypothetical protein
MNVYMVTWKDGAKSAQPLAGFYAAEHGDEAVLLASTDLGLHSVEDSVSQIKWEVVSLQANPVSDSDLKRATEWALWQEYIDPDGTLDRSEFDLLSVEQRLSLMYDAGWLK